MAGVHLPALKPALDTGAHQRAAALRTRVALTRQSSVLKFLGGVLLRVFEER
jgi:hypothetical protein